MLLIKFFSKIKNITLNFGSQHRMQNLDTIGNLYILLSDNYIYVNLYNYNYRCNLMRIDEYSVECFKDKKIIYENISITVVKLKEHLLKNNIKILYVYLQFELLKLGYFTLLNEICELNEIIINKLNVVNI